MADIDKKYLEGLMYRDAVRKEVEENGEKKVVYAPTERPLEPEDVLGVREYGVCLTFVTRDGQKYTVKKDATKEKSEKKEPEKKEPEKG